MKLVVELERDTMNGIKAIEARTLQLDYETSIITGSILWHLAGFELATPATPGGEPFRRIVPRFLRVWASDLKFRHIAFRSK